MKPFRGSYRTTANALIPKLIQCAASHSPDKVGTGMVSEAKSRGCIVVFLTSVLLIMCGCQGLQPTTTGAGGNGNITSVNHIIFMVQENRSLDTYFGQLPAYWKANGYPAQQLDGLPAGASNPSFDGITTIYAFPIALMCPENQSLS